MFQIITGFDISAIDKSTVFIVLIVQLILIVTLFLLYRLYLYLSHVFKLIKNTEKNPLLLKKKSRATETEIDGKEIAAISVAIYLYLNDMHDEESNVITIRRVSKTYSPWSSKIYNMRNLKN
jgi:hypothetical protein